MSRYDVAGLLVAWFPGMELGNALGDVLFGAAEPGGRLPTSWPVDLADAPNVTLTPTEGRLTYDEVGTTSPSGGDVRAVVTTQP